MHLTPKNLRRLLDPGHAPLFENFLRVMCGLSQGTCLPNLKSVALNVLVLVSDHQLHCKIDGPKFADAILTAVSP